jgi:hypothetical protein
MTKVKVKVRNYMWRVVEIEVDLETDTVMCLKEKIEQEEGTEVEKQVLYLEREVMDSMRRLDEYGVRDGSLIIIKAPQLSCSCHTNRWRDLSGNSINITNE